jgi:hypothetical protein
MMDTDFENDLFLLFNLAYEGLDKTDLSTAAIESDLEDLQVYLRENEDKPQVVIINTRDKLYPKALLFRKVIDGKAIIFAFWKRGSVCEGIAASIDGVSPLNEFVWLQDAKTGKFKAALKPKLDSNQSKERQALITRAAVSTVLIDPLNRREHGHIFGGDILRKLSAERLHMMENMKKRGLIPTGATDPVLRTPAPVSAASRKTTETAVDRHSGFVAVQKDGSITFTTQTSEDLGQKLTRELEREARLADREEIG